MSTDRWGDRTVNSDFIDGPDRKSLNFAVLGTCFCHVLDCTIPNGTKYRYYLGLYCLG
jgi:hypothetical protein